MPLTCTGRNRGETPDRGDVDDALGNFSLTLIDTLDTLAVFGYVGEFNLAVKRVIKDVHFDSNLFVSVFETNIRVLGGLLSAHVIAQDLKKRGFRELSWYQDELLSMSTDIAQRLLPAFNSPTGVPYPRINLKTGSVLDKNGLHPKSTCTACGGTMLLEFGTLSRLTGNPIWENAAKQALEYIYSSRHLGTHLVGSVINVENGKWIRLDSGVGAGHDSYYEYLLKSYILFGDSLYWDMFKQHYISIERYIRIGDNLAQVQIDNPLKIVRYFADGLSAFWPGVQVLTGDLDAARFVHQGLMKVVEKYSTIPEAYTYELGLHWPQNYLRPEFIESTYFLYEATGDKSLLEVGKQQLNFLEEKAKVNCGLAAFDDINKFSVMNRLDSFVLAETFKYLWLLFSDRKDNLIDINKYIFTTEAHLLPLSLSNIGSTHILTMDTCWYNRNSQEHYKFIFHNILLAHKQNSLPLTKACYSLPKSIFQPLRAAELDINNKEHIELLREMGITYIRNDDGAIKLMHLADKAVNASMSDAGLTLMQEIVHLAQKIKDKLHDQEGTIEKKTVIIDPYSSNPLTFQGGPALFGLKLTQNNYVEGMLVIADPIDACDELRNRENIVGKILIALRGKCLFMDKAYTAQISGSIALIVIDNVPKDNSVIFAMSGEPGEKMKEITITSVFIGTTDGEHILSEMEYNSNLVAKIIGIATPITDSP